MFDCAHRFRLPSVWLPQIPSRRVEVHVEVRALDTTLDRVNQVAQILSPREPDPELVAAQGCCRDVEPGVPSAGFEELKPHWARRFIQQHDRDHRAIVLFEAEAAKPNRSHPARDEPPGCPVDRIARKSIGAAAPPIPQPPGSWALPAATVYRHVKLAEVDAFGNGGPDACGNPSAMIPANEPPRLAYRVESYQNWCGHGQEVLTWPQSDGDQPDPGYAVWVSCRCGARLEQWVTRADAESDLLRSALLAFENTTV